MEAPEKIYLNPIQDALTELLSTKVKGDIEYIRKDAFIEKAEKFLKSYRRETPDKTGYISGIVDDKMIEDFKTYIKGE
jgi:hypothetical protein